MIIMLPQIKVFALFLVAAIIVRVRCAGSLSFLILGDWGGLPFFPYRTAIEKTVAAGMDKIAGERNTQFQVALGDNFYYSGVKDVDDKRFQQTFENIFTGEHLQTPWYFVAGNHDWNGNVSAEIAYTNRSSRWNFPNYYYSKTSTAPDGAVVELVLIDTILLCGNVESDLAEGYSHQPIDKKLAEDQWTWIEQTLANSKADYVLVGGHFPVYSIAEHGPTECLVERLRPLLFKYSVTAYICGHDHNSQHLHEENEQGQPMDYFVIGSANFAEDSNKHADAVPPGSSKFYNAGRQGGFGLTTFNKTQMSLTIISGDNLEMYQKTLMPRKLYLP